ncbi:hypothetical protein Tco_0431666 [Tanacetum coccineum]
MLPSRILRRIQRSMRMIRQRMVRLTILWAGGDDGDDDDGDSSKNDADGEDEDEEDEDEEEHLASADSAIVVPVDEPVFLPEGTEPVIPPPSTDITIGARITVRPQTSISLPPRQKGLETIWMVEEDAYASREAWAHSIRLVKRLISSFRPIVYHGYIRDPSPGTPDIRKESSYAAGTDGRDLFELLENMNRDSDMQAELLAL